MCKRVLFLLSFFITSVGVLQAAPVDGAWISTAGGDWNVSTNWNLGQIPSGTDAIAGIVAFPNTSAQTIFSTADFTIGSLHVDTLFPIIIDFSSNAHVLTFQSSTLVAELYIRDSPVITQGTGTGTPIMLGSDLDVFLDAMGQPKFTASIGGIGALSLYGSDNINAANIFLFSGANSYTGGTFVHTGTLMVGGADNITSIPQAAPAVGDSITVFQGAQVQHSHNNHYASTASMNINGGTVSLSATDQIMTQVKIANGGTLSDSSGSGGGILELLETAPGFALIVGNDAMIGSAAPFTIRLHGGGIQYDNSIPGTAFIAGPVTIDLGGTVDLNVPHNDFNCFDLDIGETTFQNTTLNKTGDGVVKFQGGTVPIFNIQNGTVIIGDVLGPETVTATGLVTVFQDGVLGGFQTFDALAGVVNSGTISPGSGCPCNSIGTLTLNGDYTQTSGGILLIRVLNATMPGTTSDLLVINNGNVTLNGSLSFDTLPGGNVNVGDKILVLDNPTGSLPISGNFSSLLSNLPPELTASILLEPNRVFVLIGTCSPFPPPPPPPPPSPPSPPSLTNYINLSIPLFTLTSAHSLQQRERMLNLRQRPCLSCEPISSCSIGDMCDTCECCQEPFNRLTLYAAYLGSKGDVDRISVQTGYDFDSSGGLLGFNYAFNRGGIGVEAGYEQVDADVDAHWGNFDIRSVFASVYATYLPMPEKNLFFDIAVESRGGWYKIHRHIDEHTAKGKPRALQWDGYIDVGYDIFWNNWCLTPLASIEDIYLHIDDYTEHKAGDQNAHVSHQNFNSLRSWLGMSIRRTFFQKCITWMPEIRGFWLHEFADQDHTIKVTSPAFNTTSHVRVFDGDDDFGVVGGELRALFGSRYSFAGSYDYYWNNTIRTHLFYGEFGVNW